MEVLFCTKQDNRKTPFCWPFLKPSDGLEPSTPSLPWRSRRAMAVAWRCIPLPNWLCEDY